MESKRVCTPLFLRVKTMPQDFIVFSKSRLSVFRFKIRPDKSWDMLIRRDCAWAFYDNVGLNTAASYHADPDNEVFLGYE